MLFAVQIRLDLLLSNFEIYTTEMCIFPVGNPKCGQWVNTVSCLRILERSFWEGGGRNGRDLTQSVPSCPHRLDSQLSRPLLP